MLYFVLKLKSKPPEEPYKYKGDRIKKRQLHLTARKDEATIKIDHLST